jgi:hypothetical protein
MMIHWFLDERTVAIVAATLAAVLIVFLVIFW